MDEHKTLKSRDYGESAENQSRWRMRFANFSILAEIEIKPKAYQLVMMKHCFGDEGLYILKLLNFIEDGDATDMQSLMVKLDMYCSKQTNDLFECFKLHQSHREP